MKKWIITWNAGYGPSSEVVEAKTLEDAEEIAYEQWKEEALSEAEYEAVPYTKELAEELMC